MKYEKEIACLRHVVEQSLGQQVSSPADFQMLKDEIFKRIKISISLSTLKRIWEYVSAYTNPSKQTTRFADNTPIALGNVGSTATAYRYYPGNNSGNVATYGYLYNWKAVMHNSSSSNSNPSHVQGICPTGWYVPSKQNGHSYPIMSTIKANIGVITRHLHP